MNLNACVKLANGQFRTVVDDRALAHCAPDAYITALAKSSCDNLAPHTEEALAPFAIEAYTLGGRKTRDANKELYSRFRQEVEDQWGVDTSNWSDTVGVLQCRSAAYHHDPFNPDVAYINWYVDGPYATFELNGKPCLLEPGSIVVFDPYCPHALYYGEKYSFGTSSPDESTPTSLFVTLEVPMADVAYLLNVQRMAKANAPLMNGNGSVDPATGQWLPNTQSCEAPALS